MKELTREEIPQSGEAREAYIISVIQGVKREGEKALNVQVRSRGSFQWHCEPHPSWNWMDTDFRLYEPEVVRYANVYESNIGAFRETIEECKRVRGRSKVTHYIKRTTGGGRTIPEYESLPLERDE